MDKDATRMWLNLSQANLEIKIQIGDLPMLMKMLWVIPLESGIPHLYLPSGESALFLLLRRMNPNPLFLYRESDDALTLTTLPSG